MEAQPNNVLTPEILIREVQRAQQEAYSQALLDARDATRSGARDTPCGCAGKAPSGAFSSTSDIIITLVCAASIIAFSAAVAYMAWTEVR